jgi:hypothetical protein
VPHKWPANVKASNISREVAVVEVGDDGRLALQGIDEIKARSVRVR